MFSGLICIFNTILTCWHIDHDHKNLLNVLTILRIFQNWSFKKKNNFLKNRFFCFWLFSLSLYHRMRKTKKLQWVFYTNLKIISGIWWYNNSRFRLNFFPLDWDIIHHLILCTRFLYSISMLQFFSLFLLFLIWKSNIWQIQVIGRETEGQCLWPDCCIKLFIGIILLVTLGFLGSFFKSLPFSEPCLSPNVNID